MELSIESQRDGDEEQRHALRRQAFDNRQTYDPAAPVPDADRIVCAYDGDRMVGAAVTLEHRIWWRGQPVPCGGVAGVIVLPEARGQGVARRMLAESLDRMHERGEVLSTLYPTTATLYRSMGYEVAGWFARRRVPVDCIPAGPADALDWRPVAFDDPAVRRVHEAMARDHDGFITPDSLWWRYQARQWHRDPSKNRFVYVGARGGDDVAMVAYTYATSEARLYDLEVDLLAGADGPATAGALGFLARNGTAAGDVVTVLPAHVLAHHLPHAQRSSAVHDWPWMLRIVDLADAIAVRSVPDGVSGAVELEVLDEHRADNAGSWVLQVDGGAARLESGGSGRVQVAATDLARLYAGDDVRALAAAGRLAGASSPDLDLLSATFTATTTATLFY